MVLSIWKGKGGKVYRVISAPTETQGAKAVRQEPSTEKLTWGKGGLKKEHIDQGSSKGRAKREESPVLTSRIADSGKRPACPKKKGVSKVLKHIIGGHR